MIRSDRRLHAWREPVTPRPAATILMLRDGAEGFEVLMTRRSATASFAPGAYVFPGGALDAADGGELAKRLSDARASQSAEQRAFTVAAIREAFEELGILLAVDANGSPVSASVVESMSRSPDDDFLAQIDRARLRLAVDRVWWLCHWITDRDLPKRFDARFFVARMPAGQSPVADETEQFEPVWVSPRLALERHEAGQFEMIFPTIRTLRRLAKYSSADAVIAACSSETPLWVSSPRAGLLKGAIERFSEDELPYGELELVSPDGQIMHALDWQHLRAVPLLRNVQRLTAPNPGMMTGPGTNTYIVGEPGGYIVIDPGPADDVHVDRIAAVVGSDLRYIVCTHAHPDHSPGAVRLKALTGAPVLGRSWGPRKRNFAVEGHPEGHEDPAFVPDRELQDGDTVRVGDNTLRAIFTPGHASNHLCFLLEEDGLLFSGDHINSGSTVVINPPDGNMQEYLDALQRLLGEPFAYILPAHGWAIGAAHEAVRALIKHRLGREAKVTKALRSDALETVAELVPRVYDDVRPALHPVASRSLLAHLEKLAADGVARREGERWSRAG